MFRAVLLLLVMLSLLAGSLNAVAHVDDAAKTWQTASHASGGDASTGNDHPGAQKHCDLCSHGFCHLAMVLPLSPIVSIEGVVHADGPGLPPPVSRPDLQDRPPK